jgi:four helix bundle protein
LIRAASSVALNLAEGSGHVGASRKHHWRIAYGSALESSSALGILQAAGKIDQERASEAEALLDRTRAMTWRLIQTGG